MKPSDVNLKMLIEPRALKLNDILEILDILVNSVNEDPDLKSFDTKELVNVFRDIPTLTRFMYLSNVDFAAKMLSLIGVDGDAVNKVLEEYFVEDYYNQDFDELYSSHLNHYEFEYLKPNDKVEFKIVDCSKSTDNNLYVKSNTITYDFILKMQSKLWNGILDYYIENLDKPGINSIQEYDMDFIHSIQFTPNYDAVDVTFLKTNIVNWAFAHKLIVTEDAVNVIFDEKRRKVIVNLDFTI